MAEDGQKSGEDLEGWMHGTSVYGLSTAALNLRYNHM